MKKAASALLIIVLASFYPVISFGADQTANEPRSVDLRQACLNSIYKAVDSTDSGNRIEAVKLLAKIKDRSSIPYLRKLLENKNDSLRLEAALALSKSGENSGLGTVLAILASKPALSSNGQMKMIERARALGRQTLRVRAAEVIGEIGNNSCLPALKKIINDKAEDRRLVDACVVALTKLGDRSEIKLFTFAVIRAEEDQEIRKQACYYLGELREKSVLKELTGLTQNWDKEVRAEACLALGKIGDKSSVPVVKALLADKNDSVKLNACEALGLIGDTSVIPDLLKFMKDENGFVRIAAAGALMRLTDYTGEEFMLKTLNSSDFDAKLKTAQIFSELGRPQALAGIENAYSNEKNEIIRLNIACAIVRISSKKGSNMQSAVGSQ